MTTPPVLTDLPLSLAAFELELALHYARVDDQLRAAPARTVAAQAVSVATASAQSFSAATGSVASLPAFTCRVRADDLDAAVPALQQQVLAEAAELREQGYQLLPTGLPLWLPDEQVLRGLQAQDAALLQLRIHAEPAPLRALAARLRALLPVLPALAASSPRIDGQLGGWQDLALRIRLPAQLDEHAADHAAATLSRLLFLDESCLDESRPGDLCPGNLCPGNACPGDWFAGDLLTDASFPDAPSTDLSHTLTLHALDSQESVLADLAMLKLVLATACLHPQPASPVLTDAQTLALLLRCMETGDATLIREPAFLAGWQLAGPLSGAEFWREMAERALAAGWLVGACADAICNRLQRGSLAAVITSTAAADLPGLYRRLGDCLLHNHLLRG